MDIEQRIEIEKRIIKRTITDALAAGYVLSVNDGEETTLTHSSDPEAIMKALMTTDEDYLNFYKKSTERRVGFVHLVYGNDGYDVINDYTTNLEEALKGANKLANDIEEEMYG